MIIVLLLLAGAVTVWWAWQLQLRGLRLAGRAHPGGAAQARAQAPAMLVERPPVLQWLGFSIVAVVVLEEVVLLACRRHPAHTLAGGRTRLAPDDRTVVLRVGHDERAGRAVDLLERWRDEGTWLRVRPTEVAGAIELTDGGSSALRAPLVAA